MKKIMFFDTTWNQILRIGSVLSNFIKQNNVVMTYGLVFETSNNKVDVKSSTHYFDNALVTKKSKEIKNYIVQNAPDIVVFAQNTIPDLYAIQIAKSIGAKIVMLQHGLLYDGATLNNVRISEIFFAICRLKKSFTYVSLTRKICKENKQSFFKCILKVLKKRKDVTGTISKYITPNLRGDVAFVIGEHWIDYYCDNYGYDKKDVFVMGNHDLDDLDKTAAVEDAICYIPSVHVEDGKVKKKTFCRFLNDLKNALPNKKIYIKLHPRSDKKIYLEVFNDSNVQFIEKGPLPYAKVYVSHNSSLISRALQISNLVILWGFKEEKELFYRDYAFSVCKSEQELFEAFEKCEAIKDIHSNEEIDKFSFFNPVGAYRFCSNEISKLYLNEEI